MCGIVGYLGKEDAAPILVRALDSLKYRGYDSAGIAVVERGAIRVAKAAGKLANLVVRVAADPVAGACGIGHTRWATHGAPTEVNAHPHLSGDARVAVVHNGIIENHEALRRELRERGCAFASQTDTEVIPQLIASLYDGDAVAAVRRAIARLEGQFAIAVIFADQPRRILAARRGSPLLIGRAPSATLVGSDLPALLPQAGEVMYLDEGAIADISDSGIALAGASPRRASFSPITVGAADVGKRGHATHMAKEIAEQPEVLARLIDSRLRGGRLAEPELGFALAEVSRLQLIACGTSWHAALLGKRFIERLARLPVEVEIASEYRYRDPIVEPGTLTIAISQSGETADTLAGVRLARERGGRAVGLVNVVESTIARECDGVLPLYAGPEIGVASTKAYTAQAMALYLFALQLARSRGALDAAAEARAIVGAHAIVHQATRTLGECEAAVAEAAELFASAEATVFLGRGAQHPTALEGALKLKEIAYVHAVGHPAGEFKHGPIAIVTSQLPVMCICPRDALYDKMLSNMQEARARSGRIIAVGEPGDAAIADLGDHVLPVRRSPEELLQPLLSILPLQRYALHVATRRGCDVDQPRNLAKSVTVE